MVLLIQISYDLVLKKRRREMEAGGGSILPKGKTAESLSLQRMGKKETARKKKADDQVPTAGVWYLRLDDVFAERLKGNLLSAKQNRKREERKERSAFLARQEVRSSREMREGWLNRQCLLVGASGALSNGPGSARRGAGLGNGRRERSSNLTKG